MLDLRNKRILITGGAGFVGSAVVDKLRARGCNHIFVPRSKDYDLTGLENVLRVYKDFRPEVVIHLAGRVGGIGANIAAPAQFFYDNIVMGIYMIHQAHIFAVEKFVAMGTGCSYPKIPSSMPFKEEDLWSGYPEETNAPYAFAKKMLIIQTQAYHQQYGFRAVNLLPANLYGPRDKFDPEVSHVVAALIKKSVDAVRNGDKEVVVWGTGKASREFLYIDDCAEAIVLATEKCETPEPINIGSGIEVNIEYLAELIARLVGFSGRLVWDTSKPDGQPRRRLDTSRATSEFGFEAKTTLERGLRKTIDWYISKGT